MKTLLKQRFLVVMMKLRLSLLVDDLAFRFDVSSRRISQIVITWVKLFPKSWSRYLFGYYFIVLKDSTQKSNNH